MVLATMVVVVRLKQWSRWRSFFKEREREKEDNVIHE
jgi:hypothetical protein